MRANWAGQITSPMNTSGLDEPPEIWVASVARLVSVSVDADTSVTWMLGYCFSNALISTVRASPAPVPVSGLADHTIEPDVALPGADEAPLAGKLVLLLVLLLVPLLLLLLLRSRRGRGSRPPRPWPSAASASCGVFLDG